MNLQERIKKVLREEDYSPAGKEVIPNEIVIHKSNPIWRKNILETGLLVSVGECYETYVGYGEKCIPAIFATNSTNKRDWFDSTYDDDIWEINTEMIPDVKWYEDRHFESKSKHIVTFQDIPKEALTLKYEGTGSEDVETWDKDSPNIVRESIRNMVKEEKKKERTHYHQYKLGDVINGSKLDDLSGGLVGNDNNQYLLVQYPLYKFPYTRQDLIDFDPQYEEEEIWRLESIKDNFDKTPPIPQKGDGMHRIIAAKELGYKTILMWKKITNLQESIRRILKEEIEPGIFIEFIERMLEHFKKKDCICDIRVSFDVEDPDYNIYLVFSQEELHDKFSDVMGIRTYIRKIQDEVKMQLEVFLPIRNIFVGYYTKPNCEWSPLNESKVKKEDYFLKLINDLIQRVKSTNNNICDMWVEYNSEYGHYEIRSSSPIRYYQFHDSGLSDVLALIDNTISSWGLNVYVFAPYYVENCEEEIKYLN